MRCSEIRCALCGVTFASSKPNQRFCKADCYRKANNRKLSMSAKSGPAGLDAEEEAKAVDRAVAALRDGSSIATLSVRFPSRVVRKARRVAGGGR